MTSTSMGGRSKTFLLLDEPKEELMNKNAVFGIVIILSIATLAATIVVSYGMLKVEGAKSDKWCYTKFDSNLVCFQDNSSCSDGYYNSGGAARDCHKESS
ncbi:MAG TPA: hypothetical protein VJM74_02685 [Nitrososphaeraceae archaeon]|nr:hypothetical protein [Nitrososphaeraceae archaeon]